MTYLFDAIVFDFDGTLVESSSIKTQAFSELYAEYGPEVKNAVVSHHLDHQGISRYKKFQYFEEVILKKKYTKFSEKILSKKFSDLVVDLIIEAPFVPGAYEFIEKWYKILPLFIASGTPDDELKKILKMRKMDHYFFFVAGSPSTKDEIINGIFSKNSFRPEKVLMVGDAISDLEGALVAGCSFIGRGAINEHPFPNDCEVIPDLWNLDLFI